MRYVWGAVGVTLALAGAGVACTIAEGEKGADAGGDLDAALDVHVADVSSDRSDSSSDAVPDGDAAPPSCPKDAAGPPMVPVGNFCIDATEITNDQYEKFRAQMQDGGKQLPARCVWDTDLSPLGWSNPTQSNRPATVDFCDAYMYCTWSGKHLCGSPKGGALAGSGVNDPNQDLWFAACTGGGQTIYPYGNSYDSSLCNCENKKGGTTVDVGTLAQCVGGVNGLYDMSGNVSEWVDSCTGLGVNDQCLAHGGDYSNSAADLQCDAGRKYTAGAKDAFRGFRCCADPQ